MDDVVLGRVAASLPLVTTVIVSQCNHWLVRGRERLEGVIAYLPISGFSEQAPKIGDALAGATLHLLAIPLHSPWIFAF